MQKDFGIEYSSSAILIVSECASETIYVIGLDINKPKIKPFYTWFNPPYNIDIENAIKEVLDSVEYDIEHEIEEYRKSSFYQMLKENEEM